ncbi:MAG: serine/threonine protein kinase [Deltaproteobacteria bacterium]|nr:serine/threonine protein kinase [Deltaproteobacteria bacterium]
MTKRFGRYEVAQPIAKGGMATVYFGHATGVGGFERRVAIKVMHPHIADDPEFVAMFLDEARLAAQIHHPNVVSTLDVQTGEDGLFLVMDYVEGTSLRQVLRRLRKQGQRLPIAVAVAILLDTLSGLHAAHELTDSDGDPLNLVHRDVSPHNILIGTDGVCRITDFGIARASSRLSSTRGGVLKGKLAYMAPEQALSQPTDRRADVYAAGIVLWELLTGHRLFRGDNEAALISKCVLGADQSPREVFTEVPEDIDHVCMRALAVDPDERYPTAAEMADALECAAYACDQPVAGARQVAIFGARYKVDVHSVPPPAIESEDTGSFESTVGTLAEAVVPATVAGDVRRVSSAPPGAAPDAPTDLRARLARYGVTPLRAGIVALPLIVLLVVVVTWPSSPELAAPATTGSASLSSSQAAPPIVSAAPSVTGPALDAGKGTGPVWVATSPPSASGSASATPAVSASAAASASASATASASASAAPKSTAPTVPVKPTATSVRGFEPEDL